MAHAAAPVSTTPRTITVRVRTLVILAVTATFAGGAVWALSWASGMQPLSAGSAVWGPHALPVAAQTPDVIGDGPDAYRWRRGGTYTVRLAVRNGASVPITLTGADHTLRGWDGPLSGPTLQNATMNFGLLPGAFHAVSIPAGGTRVVAFVFHANPQAACSTNVAEIGAVNVHFTALGVFHDTQTIQLGDMAALMIGRRC
jgi:hypothetical protein